MAMGSADIILNLIFQLPQCASPVSRIIENLLLFPPFLPPLSLSPSHSLASCIITFASGSLIWPKRNEQGFFLFSVCVLPKTLTKDWKPPSSASPIPTTHPPVPPPCRAPKPICTAWWRHGEMQSTQRGHEALSSYMRPSRFPSHQWGRVACFALHVG